jgi:hypothetical protein
MNFTVVYLPSAQDELMELWMTAPDRAEVSRAANRIDQLLRKRPLESSQPFGERRVMFEKPLAVMFSVSIDDCLVTVAQVDRLDV